MKKEKSCPKAINRSVSSAARGRSSTVLAELGVATAGCAVALRTDRLEAFIDAVLAIAITLPVMELHATRPEEGDLAAAYKKVAPEYAA